MNFLRTILFLVGCLGGFAARAGGPEGYAEKQPARQVAQGAESPEETAAKSFETLVVSDAETLLPELQAPASALDLRYMREEADPIRRERRRIREVLRQRARTSFAGSAAANRHRSGKPEGRWRLDIGNTGSNNWSPYPDRALDARTLRFPMRRDAQADKRPESQKKMEKLKR